MGKDRRTFAQGKMGSSRISTRKRHLMAAGISLLGSILIAVLFYQSPFGLCAMPLLFFLAKKQVDVTYKKKELRRLNLEFKDYLYAVSEALFAGNSIERAFLYGLKETRQLYGADSILDQYLCGMEKRLSVQESIEQILSDFAEKSGSEEIENFVEIFCYAKRGGGDFLHIITTSIERICDKLEVLEEIHTVMAEKALEQKVMCLAPLGILLFFKVTLPEFIGRLYGNLFGICFMTAALLLYGAAFILGSKIVEIEV